RIINMYGITETTVHVTYRPVRAADAKLQRRSPIGVRLPDLRVHVLDRHLEPLPIGVAGELYVGGAGVARGYLARPELTAERFVADPHGPPGARLYRTGDLGRRLAGGELEHLGRADHQVKLRGFRIELGEIEAALEAHESVAAAAAALSGDTHDERRIAAWVTAAPGRVPDARELRAQLARTLPDYMLPSVIEVLPELPRLPNGKINRRALPAAGKPRSRDPVAPRTAVEELLVPVWQETLGVERVGAHDDFFELGGNSLQAMRLMSRAREALGLAIPLRQLFDTPTIAGLADAVARARFAADDDAGGRLHAITPREDPRSWPLSETQRYTLDRANPVSATVLYAGALDADALQHGFAEVARRHEVLRAVFTRRDGERVQSILPELPSLLVAEDLR